MGNDAFTDPETIKDIFNNSKVVAVVGLSPNPERDSHMVAAYLKNEGYEIIPVNPKVDEILGEKTFPDLQSIPKSVDVVDIFRRPEAVEPIIDEAIAKGAKAVWLQKGVINPRAAQKAAAAGLETVMDRCMFAEHVKLKKQLDA